MSKDKRRSISRRELCEFVKDYQRRAFPDWRLMWDNALVRERGPVLQQIGFDTLSTGDYRPMGAVRVLVSPNGRGLNRFLNVKVESIYRHEHERKFADVVHAMHDEFVPRIDAPLDPREVLHLLISEAVPKFHQAYPIAGLAAYFGDSKTAIDWCDRFDALSAEQFEEEIAQNEVPEWHQNEIRFVNALRTWIADGTAREELERVRESERSRLELS